MQVLSIIGLTAVVTRLLGSVVGDQTYSVLIPCLLIVELAVVFFFFSFRHPALLDVSYWQSASNARNGRQVCSDADIAALQRYHHRVEHGQWYLDPDLKLHKVARKLGIPSKRLSELINTTSDSNYNGFINRLRIEHAKKLLSEQPSLSVLDVAHQSGFNSKSVFYSQFGHLESCTPHSYRARQLAVSDH